MRVAGEGGGGDRHDRAPFKASRLPRRCEIHFLFRAKIARQADVCSEPDKVPHVEVWIFLGAHRVGTCLANGGRHLDSSWSSSIFRPRQDPEGTGEDGYSGSRGSQRALLRWFERDWSPARAHNLSLSRTCSVAGPDYPTPYAIALLG